MATPPKSPKRKHRPNIKQRKTFQKVLEGKPITTAMRESGYAPTTTTKQLQETQGWKALLEKHLPDESLTKVHKQGLNATKDNGEKDYSVIHKYLETGYKIKGKMNNTGITNQQNNFFLNEEQLKRIAERINE